MGTSDQGAGDKKPPAKSRPARLRFSSPVHLFDGRTAILGELQNLSSGGVFVALDPPLPIGLGLAFWVPLPDGPPVLLRGHVRWTRSLEGPNGEPVGIGIQFREPELATVDRLHQWLKKNG